jgi:hypothetical protein
VSEVGANPVGKREVNGRGGKVVVRKENVRGRLKKVLGRLEKVLGRLEKVAGGLENVAGRLEKVVYISKADDQSRDVLGYVPIYLAAGLTSSFLSPILKFYISVAHSLTFIFSTTYVAHFHHQNHGFMQT